MSLDPALYIILGLLIWSCISMIVATIVTRNHIEITGDMLWAMVSPLAIAVIGYCIGRGFGEGQAIDIYWWGLIVSLFFASAMFISSVKNIKIYLQQELDK